MEAQRALSHRDLSLALHPLVGVHGSVVGRQDHARCAENGHGDARAGHELHQAVAALRGDGAKAADGGGAKALGGGAEERHLGVVGEAVAVAVVFEGEAGKSLTTFLCFGSRRTFLRSRQKRSLCMRCGGTTRYMYVHVFVHTRQREGEETGWGGEEGDRGRRGATWGELRLTAARRRLGKSATTGRFAGL